MSNRVFLDSIGDKKSSNSSKSSKTVRFNLNLFEPTSNEFSQFNYSSLVRIEKEKKKKLAQNGIAGHPLDETDEKEIASIAADLERRYGKSYSGSGNGARSMHNEYDKGSGYDENDGFIDNSEAYDELMPDNMDTDRGGFYINAGALAFKNVPNFERPEDAMRMPKAKKRVLSSSSSSADDGADDDDDDDDDDDGDDDDENSGDDEDNSDKHKLVVDELKNGHKKMKISTEKPITLPKKKIKIIEPAKGKDKNDRAGSDSSKENAQKSVKTTTVKDMLREKRDSMRITVPNGDKSDKTTTEASSSECSSESSDDGPGPAATNAAINDDTLKLPNASVNLEESVNGPIDVSMKNDKEAADSSVKFEVKLPSNLPADLLTQIERIVEAAKQPISKNNFFSVDNLKTLVSIDDAARQLKQQAERIQIFCFLEQYLPCTKQTIFGRIKKYKTEQEDAKVQHIERKVKEMVDSMMPEVIKTHQERVQTMKDEYEKRKNSGEKIETKFRSPRRKFQWTDEIRDLVIMLMKIKEQSYAVIKPRNKTLDVFIDEYFEAKVVPMWPQHWMSKADLRSECDRRGKKSKDQRKSTISLPSTPKNPIPTGSTSTGGGKDKSQLQVNDPPKTSATNTDASTAKSSTSPNMARIIPTSTPQLTASMSKTDLHHMPLPSFVSNSLTITPVGASDITPKPPPNVQNKVTIINLDAGSSTMVQQRSPLKSTTIPSNNLSVNHSQLESPSKRSTDHSIINIIASPSSDSSRPISVDSSPMASPVHSSTLQAHAMSFDRMAKPTVLLAKAAAELHRVTSKVSNETPIRISSVQSLAVANDKQKGEQTAANNFDDNSDSDGVEFISTSTTGIGSPSERFNDREKHVSVNKAKYKNPLEIARNNNLMETTKTQTINKVRKEPDVDVSKIMKQLKELEEH